MADGGASRLSPKHLERHVASVPLRSIHVANSSSINPLSILPAQKNLIQPVLTFLAMAIENCIRVRHGVASYHSGSKDLFGWLQNGVVLEKGG